ncbi:serine hydrolase domain-containing protein [Aestuariibius sp. HNIBRBA575]|uniref:serine hydrolase domain-containing protein n=1 Tax=Aestuariibius sp. HNIBRBA575 TaxID=3233343 RepID=UPI0034A4FD61
MIRSPHSLLPSKMLAPYQGDETGIVSMLLTDGDCAFSALGTIPPAGQTAPQDLLFEIGSISKVFTALLLAVLIEEGKIDPNRAIQDVDPGLSNVPDWITFQTLATHTSGLPRIHVPIWKVLFKPLPDDPYATFTRKDLFDWFDDRAITSQPRHVRHAYSNLGMGLLGEAISLSVGKPFLDLLSEKVIDPMGLRDTSSLLTSDQQARFMQPHDAKGKPVVPWTFQAYAGAGCLRSTARDLGKFAHFVLRALENPVTSLDRAIKNSVMPLFGLGRRGATKPIAQSLGWFSIELQNDAPLMLFHNGGTAGSTSTLYICPKTNSAAAILTNRGVAANIWAGMKLNRSNPHQTISDMFKSMATSNT